jgi:hypothetical protein
MKPGGVKSPFDAMEVAGGLFGSVFGFKIYET